MPTSKKKTSTGKATPKTTTRNPRPRKSAPRTPRNPRKSSPARPSSPPVLDPALPVVVLEPGGIALVKMPGGWFYRTDAEHITPIIELYPGATTFNLPSMRLGNELSLLAHTVPGEHRTPDGDGVTVRSTGPNSCSWSLTPAQEAAARQRELLRPFTVEVPSLDALRAAADGPVRAFADAIDEYAGWIVPGSDSFPSGIRGVLDTGHEAWDALCLVHVDDPGDADAFPPKYPRKTRVEVVAPRHTKSEHRDHQHRGTIIERIEHRADARRRAGLNELADEDDRLIDALLPPEVERVRETLRNALWLFNYEVSRESRNLNHHRQDKTSFADLRVNLHDAAARLRDSVDEFVGVDVSSASKPSDGTPGPGSPPLDPLHAEHWRCLEALEPRVRITASKLSDRLNIHRHTATAYLLELTKHRYTQRVSDRKGWIRTPEGTAALAERAPLNRH